MATFTPDASKPIVWNWINNDLEICPHEIQAAIEHERDCEKTDLNLGFGSTAIGVLSTAALLGLAGVTLAMVPPIALAVAGALHGYNAGIQSRRRELEAEFIEDYPDILKAIESKLDQGQSSSKVASAYESIFRLYRRGDDDAIIKVLGNVQTSGQTPQGIQRSNDQGNDQGALIMGNPIESQPIAQTTAALPSIVHSKVLCPIEVLGRDPYQSMGVIGGQRTGKTYTAALHTQNVKRKLQARIIYINLIDANGDAADDWDHADICITCHLRKLSPGKARAVIEKVTAVVNEFFNGLNQILVFDEWVGFTSKANQWPKKASQEAAAAAIESREAKTFIEPEGLGTSAIELMNLVMAVTGELTQSGKKQAKAIWLLSPMVKAGAMEPQGLVIKEVDPMVVAISKDESVTWKHPVTGLDQEIGFDDAGYRASIPNMGLPPIESIPKLGCVRMLFAKGTWYSLDNLPKLDKSIKATPIAIPPIASPAPIASLSSEERKAEIARMKANIERLQELNEASHDERIQAGIDYEMHDSFDPPRDRLERLWEAAPAETDPAIELINEEQNPSKREALTIAYQWAMARQDKGDSIDRQTFLERARKDRNCEYLRDNRDEIWHCLEALIN